ncbi:flagellar hook-basal body complex protein FliE [Alicyclobacillus dauci]|uniref:Flagellar hook-basal body complex protein FliE n=1 Tax=Alicyclobacillus dauci TaxID=1475485 RepID=A0ABY6YXS8_9BACL|nr:flagellar hook-basal body complex protein FliE [Alicyclobacillus dauci]WAH35408.1 flagellar hook-basal body complex protein FliE [Alicyclobacillus dauci]
MGVQGIQAVSNVVSGQPLQPSSTVSGQGPSFADFLGQALDKVNQISQNADQLAQSYATGGQVTAAQLMIAEQQASLAVDTVVQVNNRVQQMYSTMMNMQV